MRECSQLTQKAQSGQFSPSQCCKASLIRERRTQCSPRSIVEVVKNHQVKYIMRSQVLNKIHEGHQGKTKCRDYIQKIPNGLTGQVQDMVENCNIRAKQPLLICLYFCYFNSGCSGNAEGNKIFRS